MPKREPRPTYVLNPTATLRRIAEWYVPSLGGVNWAADYGR